MAFDKQALIDQLGGLTVLELVDLVDTLKETWGVEAAAAMPMGMMMAGPAAAAEAVEEQTEFNVTIKSTTGEKKLSVIKEVRAITSLGLKEAKDLVEAGGVVREAVSKEEAAEVKAKLEAAGAEVEVS
ncbi:MAG: 50S ribosomal protein L7/L12 [Truepera sp.]|jgi:large subunit ribosomal protein L7/L12|nr:50S ribosomal protein L7/L12 [Truepera sp.]HRN18141.1 50S ribosomal protein L7/L12 [Trueperaceae bacterium]HRQ09632.1 50S ribosomal protein L7/L12 [Trueperaceae bacterium]